MLSRDTISVINFELLASQVIWRKHPFIEHPSSHLQIDFMYFALYK
jgi:hypothetical protein